MRRASIAAVLLLAGTVAARAADEPLCTVPDGTFEVTFPPLTVAAGEQIVGFELEAKGMRVVGIAPLPAGWSIKADAEDPSRQKVSGTMQRASDALGSTAELPRFAVARDSKAAPGAGELEAVVYTSADATTYVRHRVACAELIRPKP